VKVGVPTEVKKDEYRVALTPAGVRELVDAGHEVHVQSGAGVGSAIEDEEYAAQGASIVPDAEAVFEAGELIVKVKEPQPAEVARLATAAELHSTTALKASLQDLRQLSPEARQLAEHIRHLMRSYDMDGILELIFKVAVPIDEVREAVL